MRLFGIAVLSLLAAQAGLAQRDRPSYENSGAMPDSPVVHADRHVTFTAGEVLLAGGNLGEVLGGAQTRKKNSEGVWTITVGPLDPGVYDYSFAVGGGIRTVDPANTNVIERTWGHTNYFEVPGDEPAIASVRPVPRGSLHIHYYDSKALGVTRRVRVYTPPGYESAGDMRYPVLYLLHGSGGIDSQWTTVGRANFVMDNLLAGGKTVPMIVVMPWGHVPKPADEGRGRTANEGFDKDLLRDVIPLAYQGRPPGSAGEAAGV